MLFAVIGTAIAGTTAANSIGKGKEVYYTETPWQVDRQTSTTQSTTEVTNSESGEYVPIGDYIVTVAQGDTLSSILRENLGSLSALHEIIRYNNLRTPDDLPPGKKILIPVYLFPNPSNTVSGSASVTPVKTDTTTRGIDEGYLTVDLAVLASDSVSDAAVRNQRSDEEYLTVDLTALESTINSETADQAPSSNDGYVAVDLTALATTTDTASSPQSNDSTGEYNVVDLTEVNVASDRRIRVNRGDSLSSILRENLGSLRGLYEVARYNNLDAPDQLTPGQIILIPGYM
jgi:LysM repeat protein